MSGWEPTTPDERAQRFAGERDRLVGLAYRMLGSRADAEDVVQDAWLRYDRSEPEPDVPAAWLTTVTARLALDRLRSARARRERYVGPWLPEPVRTRYGSPAGGDGDPAEAVQRAESITLGFLVVLESLTPEDRAVFLLAEVFRVPYKEIGAVVGRSPEACRQAAARARARVRAAAPTAAAAPGRREWRIATELTTALGAGDLDTTLRLLWSDVVLVSDGGPARRAARRPVVGGPRVARFLLALAERGLAGGTVELAEMNAAPAAILRLADDEPVVGILEVSGDGRITSVRLVLAPGKLGGVEGGVVRW